MWGFLALFVRLSDECDLHAATLDGLADNIAVLKIRECQRESGKTDSSHDMQDNDS